MCLIDQDTKVKSSLELWGDGDDIDLIEQLESVFDIKFGDDELRQMQTVGDVEDAIGQQLATSGGAKCMTAMAYYRLRRFLQQRAPGRNVGPDDRLSDFATSPRELVADLKRDTGLNLQCRPGILGNLGALLFLLCWLLGGAAYWARFGNPVLNAVPVAVIGLVLAKMDRGRFVGDDSLFAATRQIAEQSYGRLAREGGRSSEQGVQAKAREVIAGFQGFLPEEVGRDTLLLSPKRSMFRRG
jgi:hypothetical protein